MNHKKIFLIALVIAAALVGLLVYDKKSNDSVEEEPYPDLSKKASVERVVKTNSKIVLAAFPENFPVEKGATESASYKYVPANSLEQQSTLEYVSEMTLAENQKTFMDYLNENTFTIANKVEQKNLVFYYATKDNNDLSIRVEEQDGKVTVSASYLQR